MNRIEQLWHEIGDLLAEPDRGWMPDFTLEFANAPAMASALAAILDRSGPIRLRQADGSWGAAVTPEEALTGIHDAALSESPSVRLERLRGQRADIPTVVVDVAERALTMHWLEERDWDARTLAAFVDMLGGVAAMDAGTSFRFEDCPDRDRVEEAIRSYLRA